MLSKLSVFGSCYFSNLVSTNIEASVYGMDPALLILSVLFVIVVSGSECFFTPRVRLFPVPIEEDPGKPLFLTELIEEGTIEKVQNFSRVKPNICNTTSYSGYLTTNSKCRNNLFFWFFPAQEDWQSAPLVLWLEGGLGKSFMYSLFEEVGPFNSFSDGLHTRTFSWNVKNNLLFIDQPVGTGYSFTEKNCFAKNESDIGRDLYSALIQFLKLFPDLQNNNFFIIGESNAGYYIPAIGYIIHKNNPLAQIKINLKGMMIGNGWIDPINQINYGDYLYQTGHFDSRKQHKFYYFQNLFLNQISVQDWKGAYTTWSTMLKLIEDYTGMNIYSRLPNRPHESNWNEFIQLTGTRRAIHVGSKPFSADSSLVHSYLTEDIMHSAKPWVEFLLENNYPIVFYVRQLDVVRGYPMLVDFLRSLNWTGQHLYLSASRSKWVEDEDIAGYVKGQHLLFDVLVRNTGHMAATDQPFWIYQLINAFTMGQRSGKEFVSYLHQKLR